jgi:hypothetical protein
MLSSVWAFLNTNFSAALFGALAGALSAHAIATRSDRRKRLREEIAGVNSAIALSNSISNAFIAMKRQQVIPMAAVYKKGFDDYIALLRNPPQTPTEYTFITDYRILGMPLTAIEELRAVLLDRISSSGAALSISIVLHQCIAGLTSILAVREATFAELRKLPPSERIDAYFGLRNSLGHIDQSFCEQLSGVISYVDDGIYFPILLCEILTAHGTRLRRSYGLEGAALELGFAIWPIARLDHRVIIISSQFSI